MRLMSVFNYVLKAEYYDLWYLVFILHPSSYAVDWY